MIERDYQRDLYNKARSEFIAGHKRVLVVAPCGAGKSYLFAAMAQAAHGEVLILTHRRELLDQTSALLAENGITNARIAMILTEANHLGEYGRLVKIGVPGQSDVWGHRGTDGKAFYVEVKNPGETPRPNQLDFIEAMKNTGAIAGWCTSVDGALEIVFGGK